MPIYEYDCPVHGRFDVLHKRIPDVVPRTAFHVCGAGARLVHSLGFYGEAKLKAIGRLSRAQRRYHERAPEREAEERDSRLTRKHKPITMDDVARRKEALRGVTK